MNDENFMRLAIEEAELALENGEVPVGCVIASGDAVIARAHNEIESMQDPTAHAEMLAIRRAVKAMGNKFLNDCRIYVTLEPCAMCAGAIVATRIGRVIYGAPDTERGCTGSIYRLTEDPAFVHFCPADGGVKADECRKLLDEFFVRLRAHGEN